MDGLTFHDDKFGCALRETIIKERKKLKLSNNTGSLGRSYPSF